MTSIIMKKTTSSANTPMIQKIVRRIAFDIGSGMTKMEVADELYYNVMDDDTNNQIKMEKHIVTMDPMIAQRVVGLKGDLQDSNTKEFTVQIENKLSNALSELLLTAVNYESPIDGVDNVPDENFYITSCGIATQAFRESLNGENVMKKLRSKFNSTLEIIPQAEEARIGFLATIATVNNNNIDDEDNGDIYKNSVLFDQGGGSMQICCVQEDYRIPIQQPITYEGSLGFYKLIAAFAKIKEIDVNPTTIASSQDSSGFYPITSKEYMSFSNWVDKELQKDGIESGDNVVASIQNRFKNNENVRCLGIAGVFLIFPTITNNNVITLKELDEAIEKRINRTYDEILNENPILLNTSNDNSAITTPSSDRSKKDSSKQHLEQEQEEQELVPRFVPWQFVVPLIYVSRLFHFFGIEKIELVKSTLTRGLLEEVDNKLYWPDDNNNLLMRKDEMLKLLQSAKQSSY